MTKICNINDKWTMLLADGVTEMPEEFILTDNMDQKAIWEDYVDTDPGAICGAFVDEFPSIPKIKSTNAQLYRSMGALNFLTPWGNVVDIGAGYNALSLLLTQHHNYIPADIIKYTPETFEVDGSGMMPVPDEWADYVYCSNVFQHLPPQTRHNYVMEAYRMLKPGGMFFLALSLDWPFIEHESNLLGGKRWTCTGSYFTEMPTYDNLKEWTKDCELHLITDSRRRDGFSAFWLQKVVVSED